MIGGELLRDHATERKAQDVKSCQVERAAELDTGRGQYRDRRWRFAGGAADARIIEEDQSRSAAKPFVTLGSHLSKFAAK